MKNMFRIALCLVLCLSVLAISAAMAETQLRGYDKNAPKGQKYQYVVLGDYPYEKNGDTKPVLWWVLGVKDGQALLLSDMILDTQQVMYCDERDAESRNFRRMTDFAESDLCAWMNSTMLETLLGDDPMVNALVETHFGKLYPLTDEQMLTRAYGFSNARYDDVNGFPERRAIATPYAKNVTLFSWRKQLYIDHSYGSSPYWVATLKQNRTDCYFLQLCGYDGHLSYGSYSRTNVGVRPALTLNLTKCRIASGDGTQANPFVMEYMDD